MSEQRGRQLVEQALQCLSAQSQAIPPSYLGGIFSGNLAYRNSLTFSSEAVCKNLPDREKDQRKEKEEEQGDSFPSVTVVQQCSKSTSSCTETIGKPFGVVPFSRLTESEIREEDPALVEAANFLYVSEKTDLRHSTDLLWLRQLLRVATSSMEYVQQTAKREMEEYWLPNDGTPSPSLRTASAIPSYLPLLAPSSSSRGSHRHASSHFPRPLLFRPSKLSQHRIKMWCLAHEDDCRRRIKELEAEAAYRDYLVQYDAEKSVIGKAQTLPLTLLSHREKEKKEGLEKIDEEKGLEKEKEKQDCKEVDKRTPAGSGEGKPAFPHHSSSIDSVFSKEEEEVREEALLGRQLYPRPTFPNRSFHPSDVVRYPLLECTNTIGLSCKDAIIRTAHLHECRRCQTANKGAFEWRSSPLKVTAASVSMGAGAGETMNFSRYFSDLDAEYRVPAVRKRLYERMVWYERCKDSACIIADVLEGLHSESGKKYTTQLEKDLEYRGKLSDAASNTLSSVHRLRQEGHFGRFCPCNDYALPYTKAFRETHLNDREEIALPPVTLGDGHEGHFYL